MDNIRAKTHDDFNEFGTHPESHVSSEQSVHFTSRSGHPIQSSSCLTKHEQQEFLRCYESTQQAPVAYRITPEQRDKIHTNRIATGIQVPKVYQGLSRINQVLRHVATAIYDQAYNAEPSKNMVEIQCSAFGGKLHISSNFHSEHILDHLQKALNHPVSANRFRPDDFPEMTPIDQEYAARPNRHTAKLQRFIQEKRFNRIQHEIKRDIEMGKGGVSGSRLTPEAMKQQALSMLNVIREALQQAQRGDFERIEVHAPLHGGIDPSSRETMHAEQNIESHIAMIQNKLRTAEGNELIIPMAGRFVACATCNEIEHHAQETGLFQSGSGLKLHRSSKRVGMAYPNETQYLATQVVGRPLAEKVAQNFRVSPENLSSHGHHLVTEHAFDTASDTDPDSLDR